jgi:hypothetical protein
MLLTVKVNLNPTDEQRQALLPTVEPFNAANLNGRVSRAHIR